MSSIPRRKTLHGISVFGLGVFTNDKNGRMLTYPNGSSQDDAKQYAEHGPDGEYDGRYLGRFPEGFTVYGLYERGKLNDSAYVYANGDCDYNDEDCAPDDPRLLALIAQVAPVEVCPAAPTPHPPSLYHLSPGNRPVSWLGLLQALAKTMATEVHPHASLVAVRHNPTAAALRTSRPQSDA